MSIILETTEMRDAPETDLPARTERGQKEDRRGLRKTYVGGAGGGGGSSVPLPSLSGHSDTRLEVATVEEALTLATPSQPHQTDKCLFKLNRALLTVELKQGRKLSLVEQKDAFDRWYAKTAELGLLQPDQPKDEYLKKFMKGRHYARKPLGPTLDFPRLLAAVDAAPLPPEADLFEDVRARRLVGLCRLFQMEAGSEPFYLSCRKAAAALGVENHQTTAGWLFTLVVAGVLEEVSKGAGLMASRYRYKGA